MLARLLKLHQDNSPFVILDSAGGCGLQEFEITMDIMREKQFLLLLDDVHHLKHFSKLESREERFPLSVACGRSLSWLGPRVAQVAVRATPRNAIMCTHGTL